jgi:hypothetical protein
MIDLPPKLGCGGSSNNQPVRSHGRDVEPDR